MDVRLVHPQFGMAWSDGPGTVCESVRANAAVETGDTIEIGGRGEASVSRYGKVTDKETVYLVVCTQRVWTRFSHEGAVAGLLFDNGALLSIRPVGIDIGSTCRLECQ